MKQSLLLIVIFLSSAAQAMQSGLQQPDKLESAESSCSEDPPFYPIMDMKNAYIISAFNSPQDWYKWHVLLAFEALTDNTIKNNYHIERFKREARGIERHLLSELVSSNGVTKEDGDELYGFMLEARKEYFEEIAREKEMVKREYVAAYAATKEALSKPKDICACMGELERLRTLEQQTHYLLNQYSKWGLVECPDRESFLQ